MTPRPAALSVALILMVGLALGAGVACSGGEPSAQRDGVPTPTPTVDRFDGDRALALARLQVRYGPRPAGSPALRRLAARLRTALPNGRLEAVPGRLRNVVGLLPGTRPAILLAAHYDTKAIPDFVGANDAAGGTAVVLELARVLRRTHRPTDPEIRFALFDGEESPDDTQPFEAVALRGSRAYLRANRSGLGAVILVDFVGQRGLRLPREGNSHAALWARLRAGAARAGVGAVFPDGVDSAVIDDHVPFARAGIPAIDLIDFDYPHFHQPSDTLDKLSPRSLDATGEALVAMLERLDAAALRGLRGAGAG